MLTASRLNIQSKLSWLLLRFQFRVNEAGSFPRNGNLVIYKILNLSIKKIFCIFPGGRCELCPKSNTCSYLKIFPSELPSSHNKYDLVSILCKNFPHYGEFKENDNFSFDVILLGNTINFKYYILEVPNLMILFKWFSNINWLRLENHYSTININHLNTIENFFSYINLDSLPDEFHIEFTSPLIGKYKGKPIYKLISDSFQFLLINRFKLLTSCFGTFINNDLNGIKNLYLETQHESKGTIKRFSSKQNQSFFWHFVQGKYKVKTSCPKLKFLLFLGELFGIGKNTHLGYGSFKILNYQGI